MGLEYSDKNHIFWAETFFQCPLRIFLWILRACLRYLKGSPNIVLYVSKKIVTARHTNKKILTKNLKKTQKKKHFIQLPFARVSLVGPVET